MVLTKKKKYPSKTTVNLAIRERSPRRISRVVCFLAILAVLVGLFSKFAVIDRLSAANQAQADTARAQALLNQLLANNSDYESVRVEYSRYFSADLTESGAAAVDCMEVLELIESRLMPRAGISSASFSGSQLSLQLVGIDLDGASALLAELDDSPIVAGVELYTADAGDALAPSADASVSMTITLIPEGGGAQ